MSTIGRKEQDPITMERRVELVKDQENERLDQFVARHLVQFSRSEVQRWIRAGKVLVDERETKPSQRLESGQRVVVFVPASRPAVIEPWDVPLDVLYEDVDCVVLNKPAGLVVHPATSHRQDTLVNALLARYPEIASMSDADGSSGLRPGIVHRLDKDTSGTILIARHRDAWLALQRQFRQRRVEKVYQALLYGRLSPREGTIVAPIGRDPRNRKRMAVMADGREAETRYRACEFLFTPHGTLEFYTLAEIDLRSGRTHQIRVHLAHLGYPVVGDMVYGRRKARLSCPRQFLHAGHLGFFRPSDGEWIVCQAPLPADLQAVLSGLSPVV
jgi:23S rRNA pseudouridine1911/1915/1917 synthase